ncbi:biotin transporter BioY [Ligilactobacillus equi]
MTSRNNLKKLILAALLVAIIIVLGLLPGIPLGIIPVPIIFQNMGIMLAGLLLGPRYGSLATVTFVLLVALGFPFLSGGNGGMATLVGPTGGYILSWLLVPIFIGWFTRQKTSFWLTFIGTWLWGVLFADICGSLWLAYQSHLNLGVALASNLIFIPGDTIKALLASLIAHKLKPVIWR